METTAPFTADALEQLAQGLRKKIYPRIEQCGLDAHDIANFKMGFDSIFLRAAARAQRQPLTSDLLLALIHDFETDGKKAANEALPDQAFRYEIGDIVRREIGLPLQDNRKAEMRFVVGEIGEYKQRSENAASLPSRESLSDIVIPVLTKINNVYKVRRAAGKFFMPEEDAAVLRRETLNFLSGVLPPPESDAKALFGELRRTAYPFSPHGMTADDLLRAYKHMYGSAGSDGYHHAVNDLFTAITDSLLQQYPAKTPLDASPTNVSAIEPRGRLHTKQVASHILP